MNMIKTLVISLAVVLGMTFSAVAADKVRLDLYMSGLSVTMDGLIVMTLVVNK